MPIYRDKARGRFVFEFDRRVAGQRLRTRKILPKAWNQAQADKFDREESARLYACVKGIERPAFGIEQAISVYLDERVPQLKHGSNAARELALMFDYYRAEPLERLPEVCQRYAKEHSKTLSPATIRNRIRYLTSACRYAWKHHGMSENDPAARVTVPTVRNERQNYISRAQMIALVRACTHPEARKAIRIAFYSGMRLGEILKYRLSQGAFWLDDTKNGEPRIVPVHPKLVSVGEDFDQRTPKITIQRAFQRARDRAELPHVHFHDLRHSAASELINAGIDLYIVGRVLGHKDPRSTQRYAHLAMHTLAEAVGKIGGKGGQEIPHHRKKKAA